MVQKEASRKRLTFYVRKDFADERSDNKYV